MKRNFKAENYMDGRRASIIFEDSTISECPSCHKIIEPNALFSCVYCNKDSEYQVSIVFFCRSCLSTFIGTYSAMCLQDSFEEIFLSPNKLLTLAPQNSKQIEFPDTISELSPRFVKIYNQSLSAETNGLDEIVGLGYRKSLEFLIKDFAIHCYPDDEETIKKSRLINCINNYIDDPRIKAHASRSTWIGNDEAHYVRKHEDLDFTDMKNFIEGAVYYIGFYFKTEDVKKIEPIK